MMPMANEVRDAGIEISTATYGLSLKNSRKRDLRAIDADCGSNGIILRSAAVCLLVSERHFLGSLVIIIIMGFGFTVGAAAFSAVLINPPRRVRSVQRRRRGRIPLGRQRLTEEPGIGSLADIICMGDGGQRCNQTRHIRW